jgi:hypothetical protein
LLEPGTIDDSVSYAGLLGWCERNDWTLHGGLREGVYRTSAGVNTLDVPRHQVSIFVRTLLWYQISHALIVAWPYH